MEYKNIAGKVLMETVMQDTHTSAEGAEAVKVITWLKPSHFASKEEAKEFKLLCAHLAEVCIRYDNGQRNPEAMQKAMDEFNKIEQDIIACRDNAEKARLLATAEALDTEACKYASKAELKKAVNFVLQFFEPLLPAVTNEADDHVVFPTNNDFAEVYARSVNFRNDKSSSGEVREGVISETACAHAVQELAFLLHHGKHFPKRKLNKATTTTLFKEAEEKRKKAEQEAENKKRSELQEKQEAEKAMETVKKEEEAKKKRSTTSKKDTTTKESGVRVKKQDTTTKTEANKQ